jgi:hypothetical protein
MADYCASTRTNYFAVTDEARFREIMASCVGSDDKVHVFELEGDPKRFGFGCYERILGTPTDDEDDMEYDSAAFYAALQSILAEGDAIIVTEVGNTKLRYLTGVCIVVTRRDIQWIYLHDKAIELARAMLNNPSYETQMDY